MLFHQQFLRFYKVFYNTCNLKQPFKLQCRNYNSIWGKIVITHTKPLQCQCLLPAPIPHSLLDHIMRTFGDKIFSVDDNLLKYEEEKKFCKRVKTTWRISVSWPSCPRGVSHMPNAFPSQYVYFFIFFTVLPEILPITSFTGFSRYFLLTDFWVEE